MERGLLVLLVVGVVGFVGGMALALLLCRRLFHAANAEAVKRFSDEAATAKQRILELTDLNEALSKRCHRVEQRLADNERRREEERKEKETSNRTILERTEAWLRGGPIVPREPEPRPDRFAVEGMRRPDDLGVTESSIMSSDIGRALRHRDEQDAMLVEQARASVREVLDSMTAEERARLEALAASQHTTGAQLLSEQALGLYREKVAADAILFKAGDALVYQDILSAILGDAPGRPQPPQPEVVNEPTDGLVDQPEKVKGDARSSFGDVGYVD